MRQPRSDLTKSIGGAFESVLIFWLFCIKTKEHKKRKQIGLTLMILPLPNSRIQHRLHLTKSLREGLLYSPTLTGDEDGLHAGWSGLNATLYIVWSGFVCVLVGEVDFDAGDPLGVVSQTVSDGLGYIAFQSVCAFNILIGVKLYLHINGFNAYPHKRSLDDHIMV